MARAKDALLLSNGPLELETGVKPGRSATNTSTPCGLGEVQLWEEWPKLKKQIKKVPTLREFSKRLREYAERYTKPGTARFYRSSTENLFSFDALADARLDAVNGELITAYVRNRKAAKLSTARINGELRTLRRILSLAADWQLIPYRTAVHELPNEEKRDRVLTYKEEQFYLLHSTDNLRDATIITVDRVSDLTVNCLYWNGPTSTLSNPMDRQTDSSTFGRANPRTLSATFHSRPACVRCSRPVG